MKTILSLGLNDKDTKKQKYSTMLSTFLVVHYLHKNSNGFTIYNCKGGYRHEDGYFVKENSIRIELFDNYNLDNIINHFKTKFNQESIAVEQVESNVRFI